MPKRSRLVVLIVAVTILGAKFFYFIWTYSVNVFYFDQWDFLTPFFQGKTAASELFVQQYGQVRLGLGLIALKYLYRFTHWNTRIESIMIGGGVFAAMLLALWLKRRLYGEFSFLDIAIPLIFLTLTQLDTFIGAPDPAYSGIPLPLILLYCLALLVENHLLRYVLILVLNLFLVYTGYGVFMGVMTLAVCGLDCYRHLRGSPSAAPLAFSVSGLVIACVSLGSFFLNYSFLPAVDCFTFLARDLTSYPQFMGLLFSSFLGPRRPVGFATVAGMVGLAFAIAVVVICLYRLLSGAAKGRPKSQLPDLIITVLLSYSLLFALVTAIGRVCVGLPDAAQPGRYSTLMIPAFLAIYFFLLFLPQTIFRKIILAAFLLVVAPGGALYPSLVGHKWRDGKRAWVGCYLRTKDIEYCNQATGFPIHPNPDRSRLKEKLEYLEQNHLSFFYKQ